MSISRIVDVQTRVQNASLSVPGFDTALFIGPLHSNFATRVAEYASIDEAVAAGFKSNDPIMVMVAQYLAQSPRAATFKLGRRTAPVAQVDQVHVVDQGAGDYALVINGRSATVTAVDGDSASDIRDALVTAVNGLAVTLGDTDVTAAPVSTDDLSLTADTAGISFTAAIGSGTVTGGLAFTQNVTAAAAGADGTYSISFGSVAATVAASGLDAAAIAAALITATNALTSTTGVTASAGAVANTIDLDGAAPFTVELSSPGDALVATGRTLSHGLAEDIAAMSAEDPDFYLVMTTEESDDVIFDVARYVETATPGRRFHALSRDTNVAALPYAAGSASDIATRLKDLGYTRTSIYTTAIAGSYPQAAVAGRAMPEQPGSVNWNGLEVRGIVADAYTTSQLANLLAKSVGGIERIAGVTRSFGGAAADGEWIDVYRGVDKLDQDIGVNFIQWQRTNTKINFTQGDLDAGASNIQRALDDAVDRALIAASRVNANGETETPAYTITVPSVASIPANVKSLRQLTTDYPYEYEATLAGGLNKITIRGTVGV